MAFSGKVVAQYWNTNINSLDVLHSFSEYELDCGMMMAHYFFFIAEVNRCIFFCTAGIFAKLTKKECDWGNYDKHTFASNFAAFVYPILAWVCIKYDHHYIPAIWFQSLVTIISPITYFYTLVNLGEYDWI